MAHRAGAEDGDDVPRLYVGHVRPKVPRRKNVGQHDSLVIAHLFRQLDQIDVSERNPCFLGLQPVNGTGLLGAAIKSGTGIFSIWIGIVALGVIAGPTIGAIPASDR